MQMEILGKVMKIIKEILNVKVTNINHHSKIKIHQMKIKMKIKIFKKILTVLNLSQWLHQNIKMMTIKIITHKKMTTKCKSLTVYQKTATRWSRLQPKKMKNLNIKRKLQSSISYNYIYKVKIQSPIIKVKVICMDISA